MTVSAFLRIVFGAADLKGLDVLLQVLGTRGTAFILIVLSAIEVLVIARLKPVPFSLVVKNGENIFG